MRRIHGCETKEEFKAAVNDNAEDLSRRVVPIIRKWMHKAAKRECPSCAVMVFRQALLNMVFNTLDSYTEERHRAEISAVVEECNKRLGEIIEDDEKRLDAMLEE